MEIKELLEELEKKLVEKGRGVCYGPMYVETNCKKGISVAISDGTEGPIPLLYALQQAHPGLGGPMKPRKEDGDEDDANVDLHKQAARLRGRIRVLIKSICKLDEDGREKLMPEREELMDYLRLLSHKRNTSKQTIEDVETNVDCIEEILKKK